MRFGLSLSVSFSTGGVALGGVFQERVAMFGNLVTVYSLAFSGSLLSVIA